MRRVRHSTRNAITNGATIRDEDPSVSFPPRAATSRGSTGGSVRSWILLASLALLNSKLADL